ncbi:MAG: hypothetical protein F6K10_26025 [Moorea sp. SIO2B7]|nr:hypothetical protein [Moorena sp. SIO2B7]
MPLEDIVKKAFYIGVGAASYAAEKAGSAFQDLTIQAEKLAEEMVERGEMTTEEARKFVDDLVKNAQQEAVKPKDEPEKKEPRLIEIITEDEEPSQKKEQPENIDALRQQLQSLQEELGRLKDK